MHKKEKEKMYDKEPPSNFDLYKIALDTRNMEIGLFWRRSNYFLILNTSTAVGFFFKATEGYQILIGLFGFTVAVLWFGINLGSKFWQSRWEQRLKEAENNLEGSIEYFSASLSAINLDVKKNLEDLGHSKFRKIIDKLVLKKYSVSFIMTLLSMLFILLWVGLLIILLCK